MTNNKTMNMTLLVAMFGLFQPLLAGPKIDTNRIIILYGDQDVDERGKVKNTLSSAFWVTSSVRYHGAITITNKDAPYNVITPLGSTPDKALYHLPLGRWTVSFSSTADCVLVDFVDRGQFEFKPGAIVEINPKGAMDQASYVFQILTKDKTKKRPNALAEYPNPIQWSRDVEPDDD
jgi:hypothetical protein